jgi:large subunit ribosomal protein L9
MKVILLKDIPKVGKKFEVKEIAEGYARNKLFPHKLAEPATPERVLAYQRKQQADVQKRAHEHEALVAAIEALQTIPISVSAKADERGHLFKKLRASDIERFVFEQTGTRIPEECFGLEEPITTIGEHRILVSVDRTKVHVLITITRQ